MLHGIGGFLGGVAGYLLFCLPVSCAERFVNLCTDQRNVRGSGVMEIEGPITVGALLGIAVGHIAKSMQKA
jgi:hypothetical protein